MAADFLDLHRPAAGFVLPNAWDAGTAKILEHVGFPALATTSAGIAFAAGRPDGGLDRETTLDRVAAIVEAVGCPVSADLEAGYGADAEEVAVTFERAVSVGVVGANVEDAVPGARGTLFEIGEAVERVAAARGCAPRGSFVLNARTDTYLAARANADRDRLFDQTVERAEQYVAAGADCVFVPGVDDGDTIRRLADAVPAPLNIVAGLTAEVLDAATLRSLGVARISVGGSLARAMLAYVERAGREMLTEGTFRFATDAIPHAEMQQRFA